MKTLVLADNQDVTCIGIETVWQLHGFGAGKGLRVFSEKELSEALLENRDAVVVLDYTLFDCTAEQLFVLKERFSGIHFILFSDSLSEDFVRRMVCGREGFSVLLKDSSLEEIKACFAAALEGRLFVCEKVSSWLYAKEKVKEENLIGCVRPVKDNFIGEPMRRKIINAFGHTFVSLNSYSSASIWNEKDVVYTQYA